MRGVLAGLVIAVILISVALAAATLGAVAVAAIGLLLHRWFDVTVFQGALLALGVTGILAYLLYKIAEQPSAPSVVFKGDLDDAPGIELITDEVVEPHVVAWRRSRPGHRPTQPRKGSAKH